MIEICSGVCTSASGRCRGVAFRFKRSNAEFILWHIEKTVIAWNSKAHQSLRTVWGKSSASSPAGVLLRDHSRAVPKKAWYYVNSLGVRGGAWPACTQYTPAVHSTQQYSPLAVPMRPTVRRVQRMTTKDDFLLLL